MSLWARYRQYLIREPALGFSLDPSRMRFDEAYLSKMAAPMERALEAMAELEAGAVANPDEQRRVGHYWLRAPERAPDKETRTAIEDMQARVRRFARRVHSGATRGERGHFTNLLVIGIGGSALGPQLVSSALGTSRDRMNVFFLDNTDPDGMDRVLGALRDRLDETLTVVISKSGGTKETRNGMLEAAEAYRWVGLAFADHAVAVTGAGSELDKLASRDGWLDRFPMWDWVGGRTSETSAVGLLPAALQGLDIDALLQGARLMDEATRAPEMLKNPAAMLALAWHWATRGQAEKAMVVLPYKDRLELFSRYLQQLVMESIGKERGLDGEIVHQGLTVYGNKGSTDQHAYVQQLRDGPNDFFATFIRVLEDRQGPSIFVEPDATSGDYLFGFMEGTRSALYDSGRESLTITFDRLDARSMGALIALYERAVGLYARLVHINAYHQPGVEAGKKAAGQVLELQRLVFELLRKERGRGMSAGQLAERLDRADEIETIWKILEHASANGAHGIVHRTSADPFEAEFAAR